MLRPAVADLGARVEHVGSTAVPGLSAKPIIDVDVVVRDADHIPAVIERLAAIGYVPEGDRGIPGREAFAQPPGAPDHHMYIVAEGSTPHRDHVDLRDYLRGHPDEARRYGAQKRSIAYLLAKDRDAYVRAKDSLGEELLARARA